MVNKLESAKRFLLLVTPLVTSSALAPLAVGIVTSPSLAATLASSEASVKIDNFSKNPLDVSVLTKTYTNTIATSGQVTAKANAEEAYIANPFAISPPYTSNSSWSKVNGEGSNYFGLAQSQAGLIGYNFIVGKGETFSFDFKAALGLETSIDNPQSESASADGKISLQLYDSTNQNNWIPLDHFTLSGNLTTTGSSDSLNNDKSASLSFNPGKTSFDTSFGGTKESAQASVEGFLSRTFNSPTNLTLIEAKTNQASDAVPETSNDLPFLLGLGLVLFGYEVIRKTFGARLKVKRVWIKN